MPTITRDGIMLAYEARGSRSPEHRTVSTTSCISSVR